MIPEENQTVQTVSVLHSRDLSVVSGVAEGDGLGIADDLVLDDIYQLRSDAKRTHLSLSILPEGGGFAIAPETETGTPGNPVFLDCCVTLMAPDSTAYEVLVLAEVEDGMLAEIYLLPLATLRPGLDYQLVGTDRHSATARFAEIACVSFTRGTHITMASGEQRPIERLQPGDRVLTRDNGPREVRWVGHSTVRAVGAFAPVLIRKGALHNENDLLVSPDHRIFVYQRKDRLGAGRAEVLVKVRHLINGDTVTQVDGGFVEYFQLLFDDHEIIFAEGIAGESLLIDPRTRHAVPEDVGRQVTGTATGHKHRRHLDYEITETLLTGPDAVTLLRRASRN